MSIKRTCSFCPMNLMIGVECAMSLRVRCCTEMSVPAIPPFSNRTYSWKCVAKTREGFGVCFPMSNPRPSSSHWFYGTGLPDLISFKTTRVSSERNWWFHTLELYGLAYQWVNSIRMAAFLPIGNLLKCWPSMKSKTHLFNCSAPIYCKSETTLTPQTVAKK